MKHLLFGSAALVALIAAGPAFAADMPVKAPVYKAAPPVALYSWTGCYLGGNVGYGWEEFRVDDVTVVPNVLNGDSTVRGAVGGGQVGCDYQVGGWVFGLQGMFNWTGIKGSHVNPAGPTDTFGLKTDRITTLTGRIGGVVQPQSLVYLKGGAAWVRNSYTDVDPVSGGGYSGTAHATRSGWTFGGGLEYALAPNWSVFVEYDYIRLGRGHDTMLNYTGPGAPAGGVYTERFTENLQTILVGINYRFGGVGKGPVVAADMPVRAPIGKAPMMAAPVYSWTGCYLGGNIGYGWEEFRVDDVTVVPNVLNGDSTARGAVGGGQVGCDYQAGGWVFGLQGMFDWTGIKGSHVNPAGPTDTFGLKTDRITTLTGRIGGAMQPQSLVYLKGGAAWVRNSYTDVDPVSGGGYSGTAQATRKGWTFGGGLEYALAPNWSVFVEYDYIRLGRGHDTVLNYTGPGAPAGGVYTERFTENLQTILVGINYRFGGVGKGPVVAGY